MPADTVDEDDGQSGFLQHHLGKALDVITLDTAEVEPRPARAGRGEVGGSLEHLRTSREEHEQRHAGDVVHQAVEKAEQTVVGPVQVLEDQNRGTLCRQFLKHPFPGGEVLLQRSLGSVDAEERTQAGGKPVPLASFAEHRFQLACDVVYAV